MSKSWWIIVITVSTLTATVGVWRYAANAQAVDAEREARDARYHKWETAMAKLPVEDHVLFAEQTIREAKASGKSDWKRIATAMDRLSFVPRESPLTQEKVPSLYFGLEDVLRLDPNRPKGFTSHLAVPFSYI